MALRSRWRRFESCRRRFLGSSDLSGVRRTMTGHSRGQGVADLVIMGVPKEDSMSRLLVRNYSISLDGYGAGPHQDLDNPLGVGGTQLHEWIFATRSGSQMIGREGGNEGLDDAFFSERGSGVGATIMGRNMFGPVRGPVGQERVDGLVGRGSSLSSRSIRTHAPPASSYRNARGNHLPFRRRRDRSSSQRSPRSRWWP